MKRILIFFVFALVIWAWNKDLVQMTLSNRQPSAVVLKSDPCEGKKTCALIYVAPWCPACKSMAGVFRDFSQAAARKRDVGFKIVIGGGREAGENESVLGLYGYFSRVDIDEAFAAKLGVDRYPSFYVLDLDGAKIVEQQEAFQWMQENFK